MWGVCSCRRTQTKDSAHIEPILCNSVLNWFRTPNICINDMFSIENWDIFNWRIIVLRCCVSSRGTAKGSSHININIYTHTHTYIYKHIHTHAFRLLDFRLFSSVQFSHSVMSDSLQPHELQHPRPPCPPQIPRVYSSSCPSSWWCHPAVSSSVVPFSSCPQSLPASGSFLIIRLLQILSIVPCAIEWSGVSCSVVFDSLQHHGL